MALSEEQQNTVFAWLAAKGFRGCPICGETVMRVGLVVVLKEMGFAPTLAEDPAWPVVAVICDNCGHVMQFVAAVIGLDPKADLPST